MHARKASLKRADSLSPEEILRWDELSRAEAHLASPFLSPHFARALAEAGADARVCVIRDGDEIVAFFPHMYTGGLARLLGIAQRVGGEMADTFGVVAHSAFRTSSAELLRLAKINYLSFSHLNQAQLQYGLSAGQPRVGLRTRLDPRTQPVLDSITSIGRHYLKESARRTRKLEEDVGPLRFEFDVAQDRSEALAQLIAKKRAQYQASGVPDALEDDWKRATLAKLLDYRFDSCRGVLSSLYAGDEWIASHVGLMGNGILHMWFPVYNQAFSKYSPGRLLLHAIIEASSVAGFDTIDRGEGDTPIKREIANEEYQLYRGIWQGASPLAPLIHNATRLKWRLGL